MATFLTELRMAKIQQDFHQGPQGALQSLMLSANISAILSFVRKVAMQFIPAKNLIQIAVKGKEMKYLANLLLIDSHVKSI